MEIFSKETNQFLNTGFVWLSSLKNHPPPTTFFPCESILFKGSWTQTAKMDEISQSAFLWSQWKLTTSLKRWEVYQYYEISIV